MMNTTMIYTIGRFSMMVLALSAAFFLGACGQSANAPVVRTDIPTTPAPISSPVAAQPTTPSELAEQALKSAEYTLPDIGTFRLRQGQFEYSFGSGATQVNKVSFLQTASGDLNGDGSADAVVALSVSTGGSGSFVYLVAMLNQAGQPRQVAADLVGDRVQIQQLSVQAGKIIVVAKAFAKDDPMCCPSLQVRRTYRLDGTNLKVESETK